MKKCEVCQLGMEVKCPCGNNCGVSTEVPFCPTHDTAKLDKWRTMHGTAVCRAYADKQLGKD
jgi:hypothetical protein